jgi:hypothetical protein
MVTLYVATTTESVRRSTVFLSAACLLLVKNVRTLVAWRSVCCHRASRAHPLLGSKLPPGDLDLVTAMAAGLQHDYWTPSRAVHAVAVALWHPA